MNTVSDCAVCLLKLAGTSARAAGANESAQMRATRAALQILAHDDFSRTPPAIAREVIAAVNAALGDDDPFQRLKAEHDRQALALSSEWAPRYLAGAQGPDDRLARAVRAALVGNALDLATLPEEADPANFEKWLAVRWAVHDWGPFRARLAETGDVLYLCDNAGEVAFDRVLIQELLDRGKRVTVTVKGGPALNDATLADAEAVGLDFNGAVTVITTGDAGMGVDLGRASEPWRRAFNDAGMVIAKGQANLESLHSCGREVFFLTLIKCGHVSRHYGVNKGEAMLLQGGHEADCG
jgi:damage-control phosphatase, subfamily I